MIVGRIRKKRSKVSSHTNLFLRTESLWEIAVLYARAFACAAHSRALSDSLSLYGLLRLSEDAGRRISRQIRDEAP